MIACLPKRFSYRKPFTQIKPAIFQIICKMVRKAHVYFTFLLLSSSCCFLNFFSALSAFFFAFFSALSCFFCSFSVKGGLVGVASALPKPAQGFIPLKMVIHMLLKKGTLAGRTNTTLAERAAVCALSGLLLLSTMRLASSVISVRLL